MLQRIRNSYITKGLAVYLALNLMGEIVFPSIAYGLTGGPIDINQTSFEPASTSEMVNLATGDFTYNIPLLDVDGYPINIAYHGGASMEQEASMVGLGWSLNVGAMNRMKRGLPDDFKGDKIHTEMNIRPVTTTGGSIGVGTEFIGKDGNLAALTGGVTANIGISFNNYRGYSVDLGADPSVGLKLGRRRGGFINMGIGVGLESSSQNGMSITPQFNISMSPLDLKINAGIGFPMNTSTGLQNVNLQAGVGTGPYGFNQKSGIGLSTSVPISTVTFTPSVTFERNVSMQNYDFDLGTEAGLVYPHTRGAFYRSITCLRGDEQIAPSYGYLYEDHKRDNENYLLDFNREGMILPSRDIAHLPVTNHTFDTYSATAQGVAFSARPFRSDVLVVSEAPKENRINGLGVSGEAGFGGIFEVGVNVSQSSGYTRSGAWKTDNVMNQIFKPNASPSRLYEKTYFKKLGNRSGSSTDFYTNLGGDKPLRQQITEAGVNHVGMPTFVEDITIEGSPSTTHTFVADAHYREQRDLRNTNIEYLTAQEATAYGFDQVRSYTLNDFDYTGGDFASVSYDRFGSEESDAKAHHLSEMTVLKGDGSRYVYGIPVVNHKTEEVMFNASNKYPEGLGIIPLTPNCETGLVTYQNTSYKDNTKGNRRGDNNLFVKKTIPASANSHLLTAYLSSNYVDRTGNGPSPDDFGGYTKFNYAKVSTDAEPTKWRIPFEANTAAYNEGLKANEYDDIASYVYGEREQWLIHSIESKNFVAVFEYGEREDAYGVADENGGIADYNHSKRLKTIRLYARQALENGEAPIKSVHFEYDYELCQGVPNNKPGAGALEEGVLNDQGGKLTLKGIYFTYGNSKRGKLHRYTFDYSNFNPSYSLGLTDRWGAYKGVAPAAGCDSDEGLTNFEFPYAQQDQALADLHAGAWMLKTVHLPSGSDIQIEVEADDYSYVMEKRASKMFKTRGTSESLVAAVQNKLYSNSSDFNYLHIALDQDLGTDYEAAKTSFKSNYVGDINELYFKFLVSVSPSEKIGTAEEAFEYISGYVEIDPVLSDVKDEVGADGDYDTGILYVKSVHIDDKEDIVSGTESIHPVSKASWQFMRKYLPNAINPIVGNIYTPLDTDPYGHECGLLPGELPEIDETDPSPSDETNDEGNAFRDIVNVGMSHFQNILSLGGINFMMKSRKFASEFVPEKSWVRLYQGASHQKIGGGHRVKSIAVTDNWSAVKASENSSEYGTNYYYDKREAGRLMSSGVASYEPITAGGDENTYREPLHYSIDVKMRVNDNEFQEKPFGESIFATPQVVYSQVEVKGKTYEGVSQNATGKTVYEFYTARDFPSVVRQAARANSTKVETKSKAWKSLLSGDSHYYLSMSDGYTIQINDMHGKFKSKTVVAEGPNDVPGSGSEGLSVIYGMEHVYYRNTHDPRILENNMNAVNEAGVVSSKLIGKDIDMVLDLHESSSYHTSRDQQFGLEFNVFPFPSYWFKKTTQDNRFRSSVTTKVIYSNGILEEVVLTDKGREKRTKNLLFDEKTGVPVVTEVIHEIGPGKQPIYQYDYPAYWMYKGMGMASENWGAHFRNIANETAKITLTDYQDFLNPGDEIAVSQVVDNDLNFIEKYWVLEDETTGDYYLIDRAGIKADYYTSGNEYDYRVVRSGKRNLLGSTAASITSLDHNFFTYNAGGEVELTATPSPYAPDYAHSRILNASAVEYTQRAFGYESTKKGAQEPPNEVAANLCGLTVGQKTNPYVQGLLANWNLLASYVLDGDRDQSLDDIRKDGTLSNYIAFWKNTAGTWGVNTAPEVNERWIKAAIATLFDREGYNLESKDALGIYSSILLGYNQTLKVAEAVNSRYYEIGFDGFEDRAYDVAEDCTKPHFRMQNGTLENNPENAHSGRYAMKVNPGAKIIEQSSMVNAIDHTVTNHGSEYLVQQQELIPTHTFILDETESQRYLLTAWVKEEHNETQKTSYDDVRLNINIASATDLIEKRSPIIDGWQRIELEFTLPGTVIGAGTSGLLEVINDSETNPVYVDDVRIQPYNSEMVSYVIDPVTLRLWATLDSRNFATYYQYDEEGSLVRIIQETEKGKITVQENRAGIRIQ